VLECSCLTINVGFPESSWSHLGLLGLLLIISTPQGPKSTLTSVNPCVPGCGLLLTITTFNLRTGGARLRITNKGCWFDVGMSVRIKPSREGGRESMWYKTGLMPCIFNGYSHAVERPGPACSITIPLRFLYQVLQYATEAAYSGRTGLQRRGTASALDSTNCHEQAETRRVYKSCLRRSVIPSRHHLCRRNAVDSCALCRPERLMCAVSFVLDRLSGLGSCLAHAAACY
jgi:hypothetical protein